MAAERIETAAAARSGELWRALPLAAQAVGAAVACGLWVGLASPGLQLLPGIGLADESIEISLQSALLGIADGTGRPARAEALAAADVLGLAYYADGRLLVAAPAGSSLPANGIVRLDDIAAESLAAPSVQPDDGSAAVVAAPSPQSEAPAAADPPPLSPPAHPVAVAVQEPAAPEADRTVAPRPPAPAAPPAPRAQTVVFSTEPPVDPVVGGAYRVVAAASSGLPVKLTVGGSDGACRLADSVVSFRKSGSCVVSARQAGNERFAAAEARQQLEVAGAPQTIAFASTPPSPALVGGPAYVVAASATSGLPVAFSLAPGSAACKLSGSTVTFSRAGTCAVAADQPGDASHARAPRVLQTIVVVEPPLLSVAQTISFTTTPPSPALVGAPVYAVGATASSGLGVSFSAAAASAGVCTVTGAVVDLVGEGTCTIEAHQAGDPAHLAASAQQSFAVERAPQALSFTTTPPGAAVAGETEYTVAAAASSGLPVTLSVATPSSAVCALDGSRVTALAAGTCTLEATQRGNRRYRAALVATQSFAVGSAAPATSAQTITFVSTPPSPATIGGTGYAVVAAASSGLAVDFSVAPGSAAVCSLSGSTVSFLGAGTCTIRADQTGGPGYEPAPQAAQSFAVGRASQAISFATTPPVPASVGDDYTVAAVSTSGLPVALAVAPASAGICSASGAAVSLLGAGTCTVVATQAGDAAFDPAPVAQQSFTVGGGAPVLSPQAISFTSTPPSPGVAGGAAYVVSATASSGLPVSFAVAPSSAGVCSVSGATVSLVGAGTCTVEASHPGNAAYEPAPIAAQSFSVAAPPLQPQTISFGSTPPAAPVYGGPGYAVAAAASSGLPVTLSVAPASAGVCALSGSTVSFVGAGTCAVRAEQAGNGSYAAAAQVQQSFDVARAPQTITITSTAPGPVDRRSPPYAITAAASSGLPVTFSVAPGSEDSCSLSGSTVTFAKKGDCVLRAHQAGSGSYLPAPQVQQTVVVVAHA